MSEKLLISINRPWSRPSDGMIFDNLKLWEIRKTRPKKDGEYTALVYETLGKNGAGAVVGKFEVDTFLPIKEYSEQVGENSQLSREQFEEYASGGVVYAWIVKEPKRFKKPVPLGTYKRERPPQDWFFIGGESEEETEEPTPDVIEEPTGPVELILPESYLGVCKFCGQTRTYPSSCRYTQVERDEETALYCNCEAGFHYRRLGQIRQELEDMLESIEEEVENHILRAASLVMSGMIEKCTVNITGTVSVRIQENAKGRIEIKVMRNQSQKKEI